MASTSDQLGGCAQDCGETEVPASTCRTGGGPLGARECGKGSWFQTDWAVHDHWGRPEQLFCVQRDRARPTDCVLLSTVSVLPGSAVTSDLPSTCKGSVAMVPWEEGRTSRSSSGKLGHTALPMPAQAAGLVFPRSVRDQRVPLSEHILHCFQHPFLSPSSCPLEGLYVRGIKAFSHCQTRELGRQVMFKKWSGWSSESSTSFKVGFHNPFHPEHFSHEW